MLGTDPKVDNVTLTVTMVSAAQINAGGRTNI
jgi:hypothetical protein